MVEELGITKEDYTPFTALFRKVKRKKRK